ncbi:hypothetical protein Y032_0002g826 [Ancylostoma ceylanicum]|uniref:Potassium channel domain-containing protein n=1 Tax=Ancylostoma ceylanicum TaxID=53326 RepID=A0A016W2I5_9BILA|nr:hypothetical protein Y032_0002g826 [Ancylostoma ceylanicum]
MTKVKVNLEELWRGAENLKKKVSRQEPKPPRYQLIRTNSMKPYLTWKEQFMKDRCCDEKEVYKEVLIASTPHVLLNLLLIAYLLFGTFLMRFADEIIAKEDFQPSLLFTFTTIMTIGYGSIYPTTSFGKICCVAYCVIGIPLLFLVLSNNGQFLADAYWILRKSVGGKSNGSKSLPLWLSVTLICLHSLVGGLIFNTWLGQMRFFDAVYCSFISISTIGYGDLVPVPDTWTHTIAIMAFLSAGVIILSTLFETFGYYLNYVHYIGRRFTGTKDVEIWFGGRMLTVQELITIVADQFGVCPRKLKTIIRDLDDILQAACDDTVKNRTEMLYKTGEVIRNEASALLLCGLSLLSQTFFVLSVFFFSLNPLRFHHFSFNASIYIATLNYSLGSKSARLDRAAHDGIVAAVVNLGFLDGCSPHLMSTNKKTNQLSRKPHSLLPRRGTLVIVQHDGNHRTALVTRERTPDLDASATPLCRMKTSPSVAKLIAKDAENVSCCGGQRRRGRLSEMRFLQALHALRVIHHKLNKQPIRQQLMVDEQRRSE